MLKAIEKALLLQDVDLLRFASADHLMLLAEAGREQTFKKGEMIVRDREPASTLHLLLRGRAASEGAEGRILEKTAVNLYACLAGIEHGAAWVCLEDCVVLELATIDFQNLLAGEPELSLALLKYFAWQHPAGSPRDGANPG